MLWVVHLHGGGDSMRGISCSSLRCMLLADWVSASCLLGYTNLRKLLLLWQNLLLRLLLI